MAKGKFQIKPLIISACLILFYFFQNSIIIGLYESIGINIDTLDGIGLFIAQLVAEIIVMLVIIWPYIDEIKSGIKDYIEHSKEYFKKYFKYWIFIMIVMALSNYLVAFLKGNIEATAVNEAEIRSQFEQNPIYIYISAVLIAPIVEELIFRRSIRSFFPTDKIFIIVSGFVFGALHLMTGMESLIDLLYIIPYGVPGMVFAYIYTKTNNITVPISMHIMHNGIQMSMLTLLLIFT